MVLVRVRPLNNSELERGSKCCMDFDKDGKGITINLSGDISSGFGKNKF